MPERNILDKIGYLRIETERMRKVVSLREGYSPPLAQLPGVHEQQENSEAAYKIAPGLQY